MDAPFSTGTEIVVRAADFAARKHENQRRKHGDVPYINHPIGVARILTESGVFDADVLAAALLHDTLEDTATTRGELVREFGQKIADIVCEVTDDKTLSKVERKKRQIEHAAELSKEAKLVKMADKLYNVMDVDRNPPPHWGGQRVRGYMRWARAVVDQCGGVDTKLETALDLFFNQRGIFGTDLNEYYRLLESPKMDPEAYYRCIRSTE